MKLKRRLVKVDKKHFSWPFKKLNNLDKHFLLAFSFIKYAGFKEIGHKNETLRYEEQAVGLIRHFERNLTFVQLYNVGHMAPIDSPGPTLKMFHELLLGL